MKTALEQLREAGLYVYVKDGSRVFLRGDVTAKLLDFAADNREQILSDMAEEEVHQNSRAGSKQ